MSSPPEPGAVPDFETWFREHGRRLLRLAYYHTRDPKFAEDIAQEAAAKAYKAWPGEETRDKILTQPGYIRVIVYHCFLDHIKVRSRTGLGEVELDVRRHDRAVSGTDHDLRASP